MKEYQLPIVEEKAALDMKIQSLEEFMDSDIFLTGLHEDEKADLFEQLRIMESYSLVLARRISRLNAEDE